MSVGVPGLGTDSRSCPQVWVVRLGREGTHVGLSIYRAEGLSIYCATRFAFERGCVVDYETDTHVGSSNLMGRRGISVCVWFLHE